MDNTFLSKCRSNLSSASASPPSHADDFASPSVSNPTDVKHYVVENMCAWLVSAGCRQNDAHSQNNM